MDEMRNPALLILPIFLLIMIVGISGYIIWKLNRWTEEAQAINKLIEDTRR